MIDIVGHTSDHSEVATILAAAGLTPATSLRFRHAEFATPRDWSGAQSWHHEGPVLPGCGKSAGRVAFWAYPDATEFRACVDHRLLPVAPGEVALIDNAAVEHRMPARFSTVRYFVRAWIK